MSFRDRTAVLSSQRGASIDFVAVGLVREPPQNRQFWGGVGILRFRNFLKENLEGMRNKCLRAEQTMKRNPDGGLYLNGMSR